LRASTASFSRIGCAEIQIDHKIRRIIAAIVPATIYSSFPFRHHVRQRRNHHLKPYGVKAL
jgi:hypothetical protein